MRRKVLVTGNSIAITIPSGFAKELNITRGDEVKIKMRPQKSKMIVKFINKPKQISLFNKTKKSNEQ